MLVLPVLLAGCAPGTPGGDAGTPAGLIPSAAELTPLLQSHPRFATPLAIEVWTHLPGATADSLAAMGFLERVSEGQARYRLTAAGRALGVEESEFQVGIPVYRFAIARRQFGAITAVDDGPLGDSHRVRFTYLWTPTELGARLQEIDSPAVRLPRAGEAEGEGLVVHDHGTWSLRFLDLQPMGATASGTANPALAAGPGTGP